jgi:asparaginyl-tRNA synthetase
MHPQNEKKIEQILEGKYNKKQVRIQGWIQSSTSLGKIHFLGIRHGINVIQTVARLDQLGPELFNHISNLGVESSVIIKGSVKQEERAPGGYEIGITGLDIIQDSKDYPLAKLEKKKYEGYEPDKEFLRDNRHLSIRIIEQIAILRIRAEIMKACRKYLDNRGFTEISSPIFTPSACEGKETLFETPYFGKKAILSQSGQLYQEAAIFAVGKTYCLGPTFRAEKSRTKRHLTEFWMLEPEVAFADLDYGIKLAEGLSSYAAKQVAKNRKRELGVLKRDVKSLEKIEPPFEKISYTESIEVLQERKFDIEWGNNFGVEHERYISSQFEKPVHVFGYPAKAKAFYMQPDEKSDPTKPTAECFDTLYPNYGEFIGGSYRIHWLKLLEQRIEEYGLKKEDYEWYIDLRRYGTVPHVGFGMGIERYTQCLCDVKDIQEAIPFPRTSRRLTP